MWNASDAVTIILTTLITNLRHLLLGASIAPYLRDLSAPWKAFLALWLTDESYAVTMAEYERNVCTHWYLLGANVGIYVPWQLSGLAGSLLGAAIPDPTAYGLDLVFPLGFMGLITAFLKDRRSLIVALSAGALALLCVFLLPGKWYVIVAGLLGSGLGVLLEEAERAWTPS
jgi:predicted branched-subunit amino acid permease